MNTSSPSPSSSSAAFDYHGRTHPPRQHDHPCELDVVVSTADSGVVHPQAYTVRNVTGKLIAAGDDSLTYCIVFAEGKEPRLDIVTCVKTAPRVRPRRAGRAECGFFVALSTDDIAQLATPYFVADDGYSLVVVKRDGTLVITKIFFTLDDVNFEATEPLPLWHLSADESAILAKHASAWVPLAPVHPDPQVDPGVPMEFRPQRSPGWFWFRSQCAHPELFKGKISGSRFFKFLGGGYKTTDFLNDVGFKGNEMTRFGRAWEAAVTLMYLSECEEGVQMFECGTYMHPTIPDVCAAPDARIKDPSRNFAALPTWYKKEVAQYEHTVDWTMGIYECKTMLRLDKKKEGPIFKPEHLAQMYMEMICTGSHWGELIRYCHETGEARVYRVHRKPGLAERIEKCIIRMCKEMILGTPYLIAIQHESNIHILEDLRLQAAYYNDPTATAKRYRTVMFKPELVEKFNRDVASRDVVASEPDAPIYPVLAEINLQKTTGVRPGGDAPASKKEARSRPKPTPIQTKTTTKRERQDVLGLSEDDVAEWTGAWGAIQATNKVISTCFANGDWDVASEENVFQLQIARIIELEKSIAIGLDRKKRRAVVVASPAPAMSEAEAE